MSNYLNNSNLEIKQECTKPFVKGFTYFSLNLIKDIAKYNCRNKYELKNLSKLEIQTDYNPNPLYYTRFIVAIFERKKKLLEFCHVNGLKIIYIFGDIMKNGLILILILERMEFLKKYLIF